MNWDSFFHMGGYAFYVWSAYALAAAVLIGNLIAPLKRHRLLRRGAADRPRRRI